TGNNTAATAAHIYVNGVEQPKAYSQNGGVLCWNSSITNQPFRIGNDSYNNVGSLNGKIAYTALYRGRVLSASELTQLDTQFPIDTIDVSGAVAPNASPSSVTIGSVGQNARLTFSATAGQNATVQLTGNALGSTTVSLLNTDGTTLASATSASGSF